MKRRIATVLVEPKTLYREALAHLLSNTSYKPIRIISHISDIAHGDLPKADKLLFIIGSESWKSSSSRGESHTEIALIKQQYPDARLIVLGGAFDAKEVVTALRAGASGYVLNTMTCQALIKSFDLVMCGETVLPSEFARAIHEQRSAMPEISTPYVISEAMPEVDQIGLVRGLDHQHFEARKLSRKEIAILSRLTLGDSNKTIARTVGIAEATVKAHVKAILRKINVKNRTQAALWALNNLQPAFNAPVPLPPQPDFPRLHNGELK
jgi:two-component system, NarL family, nitrate/nitrite response regulator NarL